MAALPRSRLQVAGLLGATALVALTLFLGWGRLVSSFVEIGWGLALIVAIRAAQVALAGFAWRLVMPVALAWHVCLLLRWVRESVNGLAPVAQVGGEIVALRLLSSYGVRGGPAAASLLADVLVQASTQLVFTLLGIALLVIAGEREVAYWATGTVALLTLGLVGFVLAQRGGGVAWVEGRVVAAATRKGWSIAGDVAGLSAGLETIHRRPGRLSSALAIHMAIWIFGALEVWIVLRCLAQPAGFGEVIVIESLAHAARGALFIVPGGLGVQDGAIVALASIYGVPPEMAVALALAKRVPDLVLGLPGLAAWQAIELRRLGPARRESPQRVGSPP